MHTITSLFISSVLILAPVLSDASDLHTAYPEAYTGLNKDAYHEITFSLNKTNDLSFMIENTQVSIPTNSNQSAEKSTQNYSFTQALPNGSISATKGVDSLFGQMHLNNKHYILTTNQAGIWAVELPHSGLSFNQCGLDHSMHPTAKSHDFINSVDSKTQENRTAGTVIDILMVHDQAIADRYPGDLLQTRIDQYFNVSNQTYANSNLDLAIRQVGLAQVGYDLDNGNETALNTMQETLQSGSNFQGFEDLPDLVNQTGADLVIFLRTHSIEKRGNCGIAYFPTQINNNEFDRSFGVNVMADGMSSWSICTDQLMVHEIGHNLGAGHHNADPTEYGFPADSRGFAKIGQFGTAMGSFGTGQPDRFLELNYFSNPNIQCGGGPCGVAGQRDNVKVINQFKGTVASYRNSISSAPFPDDFTAAMTDTDGDGVIDRDDEFPFDASETIDSDGDGMGDSADAFPNLFGEQVDTDGDGFGNNSDNDDDNDGILDFDDDFPLNANEIKDTDGDGVGDIADAFIFDANESLDFDQDGIGNNVDQDDDNDGVEDLSNSEQDLLVISTGNNRILRFDAQTGLSKGIEVLPDDGTLTFQSDLSFDATNQLLYFSTQSSVKTLDLMNPYAKPELAMPAFSDDDNSLGTGFPTSLEVFSDNSLYVSRLDANNVIRFSKVNAKQPQFSAAIDLPNDLLENIIDLEVYNGELFTLGQNIRVYRGNPDCCELARVGTSRMTWLNDPYAFVVADNNTLIHTDQRRNRLTMTDYLTGEFEGVFADLNDLGYSNPTGIETTDDNRLLVAVSDQNTILEFQLDTQEFLGELVSGMGLDQPHKMILVPQLQDRFHQDADKVIRPNGGSWYNPEKSGRGLDVGIFGNRLQVIWFVYEADGKPIWYYSAGNLNGHDYSDLLYRTKQISDTEIEFTQVGEISVQFTNEREAVFTWKLGENTETENIQWLQSSFEPEIENYTGMWSRTDSPGWGVAVSTNGPNTVLLPFIYDANGDPRWVISDAANGTSPLNFDVGTFFSQSLCPACPGPVNSEAILSGAMEMDFSVQPYWQSDMTWPDEIPGQWQLDDVPIRLISSPPVRPR